MNDCIIERINDWLWVSEFKNGKIDEWMSEGQKEGKRMKRNGREGSQEGIGEHFIHFLKEKYQEEM